MVLMSISPWLCLICFASNSVMEARLEPITWRGLMGFVRGQSWETEHAPFDGMRERERELLMLDNRPAEHAVEVNIRRVSVRRWNVDGTKSHWEVRFRVDLWVWDGDKYLERSKKQRVLY